MIMKKTALVTTISYLAVFVIHPAYGLFIAAMAMMPGRALAEQADDLYKKMESQYGLDTPDNDVASEDKLEAIKQKYSTGGGSSSDVAKGLQKYSDQAVEAGTLDLDRYKSTEPGTDFTSRYKATYNEAINGGNGVGTLQQPGISNGNVSLNYAPEGGVQMTRDADGNIVFSTVSGAASTQTIQRDQIVSSESEHSETSFTAAGDYKPSDDSSLITHTKQSIQKAATGSTSDSVAYRTLNDIKNNNPIPTISRDDPIFTGTKSAVSDSLNREGMFLSSCKTETTTSVREVHYPLWKEHICSVPNKNNFQSCQIKRTAEFPVKVVSIEGDAKEYSIDYVASDTLRIRIGRSGDWLGDARNDGFSKHDCKVYQSKIKFQIDPEVHVLSAKRTAVAFDDVIRIFLNGQLIGHGEDDFDGSRWASIPASSKLFPDSFFAGMPLDAKTAQANGLSINTCERNDHSIGSDLDVTDIAMSYQGGNILEMGYIIGVGGAGGAMYDLTIKFDKPVSPKITNEQIPAGCADAIGWHADNNPASCDGSNDVGCASPIKPEGGICQADKWVSTSSSNGGFSDTVLDLIPPLFPGDSARASWSANANGYFCDPLAKNEICVDKEGKQCYSYEDIKALPSGCTQYLENPLCHEKSRECVEGWKDENTGTCYMEEVTYECDEGNTVKEVVTNSKNSCGDLPCIGTDCSVGEPETNTGFANTAGMLNALSFMKADSKCSSDDPSSCKIFPGEERYCGWAVGAVGALADVNCCEAPDSGPGALSAAMAAFSVLKEMNWQYITSSADTMTGTNAWSTIYNGVDSTATTVGNYASTAYDAVSSQMVGAYNYLTGEVAKDVTLASAESVGNEVATEAVKTGIMEQAQQAAMKWAYENLGSVGTSMISEEAGVYALQGAAETIASALSVVMIAYTIYKLTVMIAQMLVACEEPEMITASKIQNKACFKIGSTYCLKKKLKVCVKKAQNYCCYSSMLPRIIMQQAIQQLAPGSADCSGMTVAQLQSLDWSKIDMTEWIAEATQEGIIPDGAEDLTMEALTGSGNILNNPDENNRQTTLERLDERFGDDKLLDVSEDAKLYITGDNVDCSYLPRPAICKLR